MSIALCTSCGYEAPSSPCPHCAGNPLEPSLQGAPVRPHAGLMPGLEALFRGAKFLMTTRGTKRWLVPPLLITSIVFVVTFVWAWTGLRELLDTHLPPDGGIELSAWDPGWLRTSAEWVLDNGIALWILRQASALVFLILSSMVAWYCFSIAYEAVAGPFLDEVHGRMEQRWFGCDPRSRLERPSDIPVRRCVRNSLLAGGVALALFLAAWFMWGFWLALLALPVPFLAATRLDREYGAWLTWILRIEGRAILVGIEVSLLCGFLLVLLLPLYLVPLVGGLLYALSVGACTAVSLIDLPLERRGWSLRERVRFARQHALGLMSFGLVTGVVFAVPLVGPVVAVPCASVGALWLVCRLDKAGVRTAPPAPET